MTHNSRIGKRIIKAIDSEDTKELIFLLDELKGSKAVEYLIESLLKLKTVSLVHLQQVLNR